jgi:hypothetical protein
MSDTLLSLAQLAVAIAGFSAIVEVLGRRGGGAWQRDEVNAFNGMLVHASLALLCCLAPVALLTMGTSEAALWPAAAGLLGAFMVVHSLGVALFWIGRERWRQRVLLLALPLPIGAVLLASALGALGVAPSGAYVAGICVQILQATTLFFGLASLPGGKG